MAKSSTESITVEILNWDKYNPRHDIKKPWWFACSNELFDNHEFFDFTHAEMLAWIYILSIASKKRAGIVTIHWAHVERVGRIKQKEFLDAIRKLERNQCVMTHVQNPYGTCTESVRDPNSTRQDKTLQDKTLQDSTRQDTHQNPAAAGGDVSQITPADLINLWNENCGGLAKVSKLTEKRRVAIKARISEHPDFTFWRTVLEKIRSSDFLNNRALSSKGWQASFDWLMKPDTAISIVEGKYDNRRTNSGKAPPAGKFQRSENPDDEILNAFNDVVNS